MLKQVEVHGRCYRLHFDLQTTLQNSFHKGWDFIDKLSLIGDVLLDQGNLIIWLYPAYNRTILLRKLRTLGVKEIYCQEITKADISEEKTMLSAWYLERYVKEEQRLMEEVNQDFLRECMSRIEQAKELLAKNKQEGASDGRQEFDSKQG